jgi:hypothetical protein
MEETMGVYLIMMNPALSSEAKKRKDPSCNTAELRRQDVKVFT